MDRSYKFTPKQAVTLRYLVNREIIRHLKQVPQSEEQIQVYRGILDSLQAGEKPEGVEAIAKHIVQGVCELQETPDPDHPDTVIVTVQDLEAVIVNRTGYGTNDCTDAAGARKDFEKLKQENGNPVFRRTTTMKPRDHDV